jgi:predicted transcriptional regulator
MAFIGLFLQSASRGERQAEQVREMGAQVPLRAAIQRTPQIANASDRVSDVMESIVARGFQQVVPVVENGTPVGFFTGADTARFPMRDWANLSVGSVIQRQRPYTVHVTDNAVEVLAQLRVSGTRYAIVLDGDAVVGVVGIPGLEAVIRLMMPGAGVSGDRPQA